MSESWRGDHRLQHVSGNKVSEAKSARFEYEFEAALRRRGEAAKEAFNKEHEHD